MTSPNDRSELFPPEREQRLEDALAEYLMAPETGRAGQRDRILERYPDLADDLAAFFDDEDCVRGLAAASPMPGDDAIPSNGAERGSRSALQAGSEHGDFELLEEIAAGGMGVVFKARQKSLNRVVALKTIRPSALGSSGDAAQRFRIEAEAVARLDHPGIVPIFEMGELAGCPYLSLKLIEGGSLDRHLDRFRDQPVATARLMVEVCRAVHYAHQRGILHRDLKPSNILLDEKSRPHVADFGLARSVEDDSAVTQTGLILGTPSYMAPEQVSGPRHQVTTAADVYGLGVVLYALLTGRPPFKGDSVYETLRQVREQEPIAPRMLSPGVDRDLEAICLKSMEKDPRGRYASAEALAVELEHYLAGEPIAARPASRAERAWRWYRRNRLSGGRRPRGQAARARRRARQGPPRQAGADRGRQRRPAARRGRHCRCPALVCRGVGLRPR
jgi:eukaryotic-like serine/threonine-protein kinase